MWLNILGFNISWLGLVLYGNSFIVIALLWLGIHLYKANQRQAELSLIVVVSIIGTVIDTVLMHLNIFTFNTVYFIPLWLMVLWACFAATLHHSLSFLAKSKALQFTCGLLFPPLSYVAGANLHAVTFTYELFTTYMILSIIWALLMVSLFVLKDKIYATERDHD
ncbi:DUF2878 domain-containing protein [Colwellia asteriadis]|uniref:DUF2878 domain-containing protein n=1 Tax=Colwellia asteriadis TaxID=517723 RepID=A0ABN1L4K5_9GAMM